MASSKMSQISGKTPKQRELGKKLRDTGNLTNHGITVPEDKADGFNFRREIEDWVRGKEACISIQMRRRKNVGVW